VSAAMDTILETSDERLYQQYVGKKNTAFTGRTGQLSTDSTSGSLVRSVHHSPKDTLGVSFDAAKVQIIPRIARKKSEDNTENIENEAGRKDERSENTAGKESKKTVIGSSVQRLGNISAVLAFDIEKQQKVTTDAVKVIYRRNTDAGLSEDGRRVIEEFGRIYGNGTRNNLSRELGQMADRGVYAVGERQQTDRGADNALDSRAHVATNSGERIRDKEEIEPVFYSNAIRTVDGIKQEKSKAEQWLKRYSK